jgi:hypothetical protein
MDLFGAHGADIVYVPGNHCFWKTALHKEKDRARVAAAELGIHLLMEGESVVLHGTRFVGATLWTDYRVSGMPHLAKLAGEGSMNDFRRIRAGDGDRRLKSFMLEVEHGDHLRRIEDVLATPFDGKTVVVTHHAPHPFSLRNREVTEALDASYASDLSRIFHSDVAPALWIHGHIHQSRDYVVGGTRILANPHGYSEVVRRARRFFIRHENPDYDPCLVVEI